MMLDVRMRAESAAGERIPGDVWVLVAAAFVIALGYGLVAPVLPVFARGFDVSIAAATMVVSAFALMRLAFAPATAPLLRRLGERPVYLSGLLIVAVSTFACAFAQSYWQLLVLRSVGGVGSVMFTVSAMSLLIRISPPEIRGRVSGVYSSSFVLGNIIGPLVGGGLVGLGLRVPFVVYAVALVIATVVVWLALRHSAMTAPTLDEATGPGVREAWCDGAYRAILLTAVVFGWIFAMRVSLLPLYFTDVLGQTPAMAGFALAAYAAGDVLVMIPAGRSSDTVGRRPFLIGGMGILALATAALTFTDSVTVALLVTAAAGMGTGLVAPVIQASVADVLYGGRGGSALSTYQMAQDGGVIAGPVIAGVVADRFGFGPAFALTAVLAAAVAMIWVFTRETRASAPIRG